MKIPTVVAEALKAMEVPVEASPACALVLTLTGGGVGGALLWTVVRQVTGPLIFFLLCFTANSVEQGSFEAWWQSTMPLALVSAVDLFASLRSIAMGSGDGTATSVTIPSSLGGLDTGLALLKFCDMIDSATSDSDHMKAILEELSKFPTWEEFKSGGDE